MSQHDSQRSGEKPSRFRRKAVRTAIASLILAAASPLLAIQSPIISDFNGELEPNPLVSTEETYGFMEGQNLGNLVDVVIAGNSSAETDGDFLIVDTFPGQVEISWDGEDEAPDLDPEGLGGVDLTFEEDSFSAQDAFLLSFGGTEAGDTFAIEVFSEAGEASKFTGSFTFNDQSILIPFADFSVSQGSGADFTFVGAITLTLSGNLLTAIDQFETTSALSGVTMTDALVTDIDIDGMADPGDSLRYTVTIPAASAASGVMVTHSLDPNTTLVAGSVGTSDGVVVTGNTIGDTTVTVDVGTLPASDVTIAFDVVINPQPFVGSPPVCAQATVSRTGGSPVLSDDPDDPNSSSDPTCTPVELDLEPPVLFLPPDIALPLGDDTSPATTGIATATDNVTTSPVIGFSDATINGPVPFQSRIERTWTATDDAGNSSQGVQTITLIDFANRELLLSRTTYGVFSPTGLPGKRQLGAIGSDGIVNLLGTDSSLAPGNINSGAGFTAFNPATGTLYFLGQTADDSQSRIFSINVDDGSATSAILSAGTFNTAIGLWYDEVDKLLYSIFQVTLPSPGWQLATIDPATGLVSFVGTPEGAIAGTIPGILTGSIDDNALYFLATGGGLPGSIVTVNLATGGMSQSLLSGANYNAIAGLVFSESAGKLYGLVFEGAERRLSEIDPATGNVTPLGATTVGGGGIAIATYTGVNTIDEDTGTFIFIGRYFNGNNNVWAIFGVDIATGATTFNEIDTSAVTPNGYFGLEYGRAVTLRGRIVDTGFIGSDFFIDLSQETAGLKVTSSDDLQMPFIDVPGVLEVLDSQGMPNRFLIPASSVGFPKDFFRVEPK